MAFVGKTTTNVLDDKKYTVRLANQNRATYNRRKLLAAREIKKSIAAFLTRPPPHSTERLPLQQGPETAIPYGDRKYSARDRKRG